MEEAIRETKNLIEGEVFLVKDLYKVYVWMEQDTKKGPDFAWNFIS